MNISIINITKGVTYIDVSCYKAFIPSYRVSRESYFLHCSILSVGGACVCLRVRVVAAVTRPPASLRH